MAATRTLMPPTREVKDMSLLAAVFTVHGVGGVYTGVVKDSETWSDGCGLQSSQAQHTGQPG